MSLLALAAHLILVMPAAAMGNESMHSAADSMLSRKLRATTSPDNLAMILLAKVWLLRELALELAKLDVADLDDLEEAEE
jgi:hypothetical protein